MSDAAIAAVAQDRTSRGTTGPADADRHRPEAEAPRTRAARAPD